MRQRKRGASRPLATPAEAETWTAQTIGGFPRGSLPRVNTTAEHDQRGPVRYWLRCCGVPGDVVKMLTADELRMAWNDTTNGTVLGFKTRAVSPGTSADDDDEDGPSVPASPPVSPVSPVVPVPGASTVQLSLVPPRPGLPAPPAVTTGTAPSPATSDARAAAPAAPETAPDLIQAAAAFAAAMAAQQPKAAPISPEMVRALVAEEFARQTNLPRALTITIADTSRTLPPARRHPLFDVVLVMAANATAPGGLWPALVGPAGSGKTTACEQVAEALGRPFYSLGALTGTHELLGYCDGAGRYHSTPFRAAFEGGGVFLLDEADRCTDPSILTVLNSALANGFCAFPDKIAPVRRHPDFVCIIAANTYGQGSDRIYVGACQLDGATLDRFCFLSWGYDEALERQLAGLDVWTAYVQAVRARVCANKIRHLVTPRASMGGALLLRAGLPFATVADAVVWKGLESESRRRIESEIPAPIVNAAKAWIASEQVAA
jgi:cobaltochelatase CobS